MSKFDWNQIKDGWEKLCTNKQTNRHYENNGHLAVNQQTANSDWQVEMGIETNSNFSQWVGFPQSSRSTFQTEQTAMLRVGSALVSLVCTCSLFWRMSNPLPNAHFVTSLNRRLNQTHRTRTPNRTEPNPNLHCSVRYPSLPTSRRRDRFRETEATELSL